MSGSSWARATKKRRAASQLAKWPPARSAVRRPRSRATASAKRANSTPSACWVAPKHGPLASAEVGQQEGLAYPPAAPEEGKLRLAGGGFLPAGCEPAQLSIAIEQHVQRIPPLDSIASIAMSYKGCVLQGLCSYCQSSSSLPIRTRSPERTPARSSALVTPRRWSCVWR